MYCTKQKIFSKKDLRAGALGLFANFRFFLQSFFNIKLRRRISWVYDMSIAYI